MLEDRPKKGKVIFQTAWPGRAGGPPVRCDHAMSVRNAKHTNVTIIDLLTCRLSSQYGRVGEAKVAVPFISGNFVDERFLGGRG